ncbi:hypothetical protein Y032_0455g1770 [Ancylostoma ceylanicum]|uniref:Uncharacterized protein n=1 Tax=Ancylostoma ceylanicum TaxID=53326 RepID=A0A016WXV7_9BILA|nr:hypothetical protein Y032_0455g1770 [Ancylostoma ceylanicum]
MKGTCILTLNVCGCVKNNQSLSQNMLVSYQLHKEGSHPRTTLYFNKFVQQSPYMPVASQRPSLQAAITSRFLDLGILLPLHLKVQVIIDLLSFLHTINSGEIATP